MSPGLRLLLVPALAIAGSLGCYALPPRARQRALAVQGATTLLIVALLISVLPSVGGGGVVQRDFAALVRGVPLGLRGDSTGVVLTLLAATAVLLTLPGRPRRPLERTSILLCLAGTAVACLGGNVYLLVGGLELGNVGALLMAVVATADPGALRRAKLAFGVQHVGSLGLLAAGLQLSTSVGTATFGGIPQGALAAGVAIPWALAGALRLGAALALPAPGRDRRERVPGTWLGVAAVPSGLVVLLRLQSAGGGAGLPTEATVLLGAVGLVVAGGGALMALRDRRRPAAVGRALLTALGGQVVVAVAVGSGPALTAAAGLSLALVLACIASAAWAPGELPPARRTLGALALLGAGGLPVGAATTGLLAAAGAEVAAGPPHALVAMAAGSAAVVAASAAGLAARTLMAPGPGEPPWTGGMGWRRLRPDATAAVLATAALGLLPGALLGGLADRLSDASGGLTAVDAAAVRGPGFGWAGGYLEVALLIMGAAWMAASVLLGGEPEDAPAAAEAAAAPARPGEHGMPPGVARRAAGAGRALAAVDRWLVGQPDLPLLAIAAVAAVAWLQVHK